jgi:putative membrane protein
MMGFDGYDMSGWMWIVMGLVMLVVTGALVVLVVFAVRAVTGPRAGGSTSALEVLKRRLAAGEITQDEYEKTKRLLEG